MKTLAYKGMGLVALTLCMGLAASGAFAAESEHDIDQQLQRTARDLNSELDRATRNIHDGQRGISTTDTMQNIDRDMGVSINQANNELDLATRRIHYQQERNKITEKMNRVQPTSSEYQRLEQDLKRLDSQFDNDAQTINRRINDGTPPVYR